MKYFFPERRASSTRRVRSFLDRCSARELDQNTMDIAAAMVIGVLRAMQRGREGVGCRAFCFSRRNRVYEIRWTEIVAVIYIGIYRLVNYLMHFERIGMARRVACIGSSFDSIV